MDQNKNLKNVIYPVIILLAVSFLLLFERVGIYYNRDLPAASYVPQKIVQNKADFNQSEKECLILTDSLDEYSKTYLDFISKIFQTAWVGYEVVDLSLQPMPDLSKYQTAVTTFSDFTYFGTDVFRLVDWVKGGGRVFVLNPLIPSSTLNAVSTKLGISNVSYTRTEIPGIKILTDFMIGAKDFEYTFDSPFDAVQIGLTENAVLHMESENGVPLLWETPFGKGRFVVNNYGACDKASRGITIAAYSLLQDAFAYPVINSSVFFIDDFPAPVPQGRNKFITKYYQTDVSSYYNNIWWPDMMRLAKTYHMRYTGVAIEDYTNKTTPPFKRYADTSQFSYFGKLLLDMGGEIGFHGYSHQPLCFNGFDFKGKVNYNTWNSESDAKTAFGELVSFCKKCFPDTELSVYVPPSNILSPEGEDMLLKNYPQIKTLSGVYIKEDYELEQEFCVDKNGIVNLPRIIAGAAVDDYYRWIALNELNYHFVNTHFLHPDDALDEQRGAAMGWAAMVKRFENYLKWLYASAPEIRNQTASEASKAVQIYDTAGIKRTVVGNLYSIDINNFYDDTYFLMRIRNGIPKSIKGGTISSTGNGIYLVLATESHVEIEIER